MKLKYGQYYHLYSEDCLTEYVGFDDENEIYLFRSLDDDYLYKVEACDLSTQVEYEGL